MDSRKIVLYIAVVVLAVAVLVDLSAAFPAAFEPLDRPSPRQGRQFYPPYGYGYGYPYGYGGSTSGSQAQASASSLSGSNGFGK